MFQPTKMIRHEKHQKATNSVCSAAIKYELLSERSCKPIAKVETEVKEIT